MNNERKGWLSRVFLEHISYLQWKLHFQIL